MRLHEWAFPLEVFRKMRGMTGDVSNESSKILAEAMENVGAAVMGRNMFGEHLGPWNSDAPWNGWKASCCWA